MVSFAPIELQQLYITELLRIIHLGIGWFCFLCIATTSVSATYNTIHIAFNSQNLQLCSDHNPSYFRKPSRVLCGPLAKSLRIKFATYERAKLPPASAFIFPSYVDLHQHRGNQRTFSDYSVCY